MRRNGERLSLWEELRQTLQQQWGNWPVHRLNLPQTNPKTAAWKWEQAPQPLVIEWENKAVIREYPMPQVQWADYGLSFEAEPHSEELQWFVDMQTEALGTGFRTDFHGNFQPIVSKLKKVFIEKFFTKVNIIQPQCDKIAVQSIFDVIVEAAIGKVQLTTERTHFCRDNARVSRLEHSREGFELDKFSRDEIIKFYRALVRESGLHPRDIELVGVFPQIPEETAAHFRLAHGRLFFEVQRRRRLPELKTLILGRNRSTRKWISVFIENEE